MSTISAPLPPAPTAPPHRASPAREALELLSSMRFAIALLTVICVASVIGTVVEQRQPQINYLNQFGPFWADVFDRLGLYAVYGTWWYLLILAFLVLSTSLCIARNAPKILADLRTFKESVRAQSLKAFHHRAEAVSAETPQAACARIEQRLAAEGWKLKADVREGGTMIAAKKGGANRIGYLLAHSSIVLICLGGLADGDLFVRAQMWLGGLQPYTGAPGSDVSSPAHRLSLSNPAFRGNLTVAEGQRNGYAVLNLSDGMLLQPLPFEVELKKFRVDYYSTGMPKLFASDVVVHDGAQAIPATIEVNKPFIHRGIAIYQSSFDDGGSHLKLKAWMLGGERAGQQAGEEIEGAVGNAQALPAALAGGQALSLELTGLRVINVENLGGEGKPVDARAVNLTQRLEEHLGAGDKSRTPKNLRNVGPSVGYKLRDAAGQAREFHNYMLPVQLDGQAVFLLGQRDSPADEFRYLRIPADEQSSMAGWMRLRAALADPAARALAAQRYALRALPQARSELNPRLAQTAERTLALFAGAVPARGAAKPVGGLQAVSDDIEAAVPADQRQSAADALIRVLNGALFDLAAISRERAGLGPLPPGEATQAFMTQAVFSLSDSFFYGAPAVFTLADFRQVQASVFQVARAPGQKVVYLGALLLVLGVFSMLYIRERRLWVWVQDARDASDAPAHAHITMALSANRQGMDVDREFAALTAGLLPRPVSGSPSAAEAP